MIRMTFEDLVPGSVLVWNNEVDVSLVIDVEGEHVELLDLIDGNSVFMHRLHPYVHATIIR